MKNFLKLFFIFTLLILQTSCGFKISSRGTNSGNIISGIISPFLGSIAEDSSSSFFLESAKAVACADPVYVKLYSIKSDGSIDESIPVTTQQIGADARYSFDTKSFKISKPTTNVEFVVKAEGCNGDIYKRPITSFDSKQDVDAKSTVVAEVLNANNLLNKTLNEVSRAKVELLINSISGNSTSAAFTSLTTHPNASSLFTEIFGTSPSVIQNAKPEVNLITPTSSINELAVSTFQATAFHIDPAYSAAYVWKLDGVVKSTNSSWSLIPAANESGNHSIDLYVGKDNGSGGIDLSKPYYTKNISIIVNNNIMPTPPNISLNTGNPNPVNSNTLLINLATGVSLANCATFSHLAITDTSTPPGIMQFNIDCTSSGTQTESVTLSSGDGNKTLYLWAMDNEGNISGHKTVSFILDTEPPIANLSFSPTIISGGSTQIIHFSASDSGVGLNTLDLYFSSNSGASYSLLSHLSNNDSTYTWSVPTIDTTNAKIKFIATDLIFSASTHYSNAFTIDSTAPTAPTITRISSAISNSTTVTISTTCIADYDKIYYSEGSAAPALNDVNWEACNSSKSFTVASGDGQKTIYAFTKDAVGNISPSSNINMTLDTTLPTLALTSMNSGGYFQGSSSQIITWTASDTNLASSPISISYSTDGLTYTGIVSNTANTGTYSWTVPNINSAIVNLKISVTDFAGNINTTTSNIFAIDSIAPIISSFTVANGTASIALPSVSVQVSASDSGSGISKMRLSESSIYANDSWQNYSATEANFILSSTNGAKNIYIWVKDNAGNISSSSSTNIYLDFGNPPTISISSPDGTTSYTSGQIIPITFSCTGVNGLASNPIAIKYTLDNGVTFINITSNIAYTSGAQTYNWTLPSGITQPIRVRVDCSSSAGVVANSLSQFFNTGGWKIYIGNPVYGIQNVNANVADIAGTNVHLYGDTYGNIYYQKNSAIMKIDKDTGLVTTFAGNPNSSSCSLSNGVNATSVNMDTPYMLGFDSVAMTGLLVGQNCGGSVKVYRIDVDTSIVTLIATLDPNTNIASAFLTNDFHLIFIGTSNKIFTVSLSSSGNTPTNIATTSTSEHIMASPDGNNIWVSNFNNGSGSTQKLTGNINSGNPYTVSNVASSGHAVMNHCVTAPFDNRYIYCQNRDNWPIGRSIYVFDPQTETFPTTGLVSYPGNDDSGNISIGFMKDKLLVRYLDQIYTSVPMIEGTWAYTTIAGRPSTVYGNGSNPLSAVGLSGALGIDYNTSTQELYITSNQASLRKIDLSTATPTISTLFGPNAYSTGSNRLNPSTNKMASFYTCSYLYINSLLINSTSVTGSTPYLAGTPGCGNATFAATFPIPDGASVTASNSGSFYFHGNGPGVLDSNNFVMHSNDKVYFFGKKLSDNSSPMIYSSDGTIINQIAGLTGAAAGYNAGDNGNLSLGAKLKDVTMMLEIKSGTYSGDLLIVDNNFLRRISVTTESAAPRIYDVLDLTTIAGYTSDTVMNDAYYDTSSETSGLGTGNLYYVTASSLHKLNPQTLQDTQYPFNGTTLSGSMRITKIPEGILITQPALNRILIVPL